MQKIVSTGYTPRALQAELHRNMRRFNVLNLHRRFGKTHLSLNEMIDKALRNQLQNPQYAYIAPSYMQAKRVAWDILKNYLRDIPGVEFNEGELRAEIHRPATRDKIRILLLGAENHDGIRGLYLDGCVLDEYAIMNPDVWTKVVRPALSDRIGWAIFISTPSGQNHFYHLYELAKKRAKTSPEWFAQTYKASQTGIVDAGELEEARAIMSESEYEQEFECSFSASLVGAYFGKEMDKADLEGRICSVPHEKANDVITAWDLGMSDTTVIWFVQIVGKEIRIIDYLEQSGQGLDYYAKELQKKPYVYARHLMPHDTANRELGTGKSRLETLRTLGLKNIEIVPKTANKADDINAARMLIGKCWFEIDKAARGIETLKNYTRKWDSKGMIFQEKPKHDWASHGADAFQTLAMGLDENRPDDETISKYSRQTVSDYDIFGR